MHVTNDGKRLSFKRYWRSVAAHPALKGRPRKWRRWQVLEWYHEEKREPAT